MAQPAVPGPFGEADLSDELRLHPRHGALADRVAERRVVAAPVTQLLAQGTQQRAVEAGADLAGVAQLAVVVVAHEQRAELDPGALGLGEAADHQLLAVRALELQPVARAPAAVGALGPLGDQPFPPLAARLDEE